MNKELEETVKQACEYNNMNNTKAYKITLIYLVIGIICLIINQIISELELTQTFWVGFTKGASCGMTFLALIFAILFLTGKVSNKRKK